MTTTPGIGHEEWRPVAGYPYEVSSLGRIKRGDRILKPRPNSNGYLRVCLRGDGIEKEALMQRLVCTAFHGEPPTPEHHADHEDDDRSNNSEGNLR